MPYQPKYEKAKQKSARMTKRAKWMLWLPIPVAILCTGWLKRLFCKPATRADEKDRQSGIRRELRGLPAEHDQGRPVG
jgi:hypothetical protein